LSRQRISATLDFAATIFDLDHSVNQLPITDELECGLEEFALEAWRHVRNNDHKAGVYWHPPLKSKKVGSIIGDECVVAVQD